VPAARSQDVPRQILILHQLAQVAFHVLAIDHDASAVAIRRIEGHRLEQRPLARFEPGEADFDQICRVNIDGTYRVFEACRRAGPRRIVYASSNHAVGFTQRSALLPVDVPLRPDTYYGVSKVFGEALAALYADKYGMEIACLRIGSCFERPRNVRMLSTWLSPGDVARLVDACLTAPGLGFATVYGTSANTRGWWDLEPARALGYQPLDDAEVFAGEILIACGELSEDDPDYRYVGGPFTEVRPPGQAGG